MEKIEEVKVRFIEQAYSALAQLARNNEITIERQAERIILDSLLRRGLITESMLEKRYQEVEAQGPVYGHMADDSHVKIREKR